MTRPWLAGYREKAELSHEEVAKLIGKTRQYYSMIENGNRNPSVEVAMKIASVLNFEWTIFFEVSGNKMLPSIQNQETA